GNRGINPLDAVCREHDIAYANNKDLSQRHAADKILAKRAKERVTAKDARWGERLVAAATWGAMNVKKKLGMGIQRTSTMKKKKPIKKGGNCRLPNVEVSYPSYHCLECWAPLRAVQQVW
ncbi:hypothetical protein KPH14_001332, partial [Odynerus spinipes]